MTVRLPSFNPAAAWAQGAATRPALRGLGRAGLWAAGLAAAVLLAGCDAQRMAELQPGVSTEADVRSRMGEPNRVWDDGNGARSFEYPRQPAGQVNYMARIGADGKLIAIDQVLHPAQFAKVVPGMPFDAVERLLGTPASRQVYARQPQHVQVTWRYLQPPSQAMAFTAVFGTDGRVLSTATGEDTTTPEMRGGR